MRHRCSNPNTQYWANYGGRGIRVAPEWDDFAVFLADVGRKPGPGYSLDRIDNDGNYEPGNVRWATAAQQSQNSRNCKLTPEEVAWIRAQSSEMTHVAIARQVSVSANQVGRIRSGNSWVESA
jgi:hypothetical protein